MPEAGGPAGSPRLSDLESRWRFDRSPRVFLQLADELRRTGALPRAIEVLQEGLSHHPESVSGRVALGRAQLEAGDASAAAETLERVLARDPAQIVASKLLIETWIRMGDAARARERLDIYRILQERDSEIDEYERRIAAMERSERMPTVFELAGASAPPPTDAAPRASEIAVAGPAAPAEPVFDLGPDRELPPLELMPEIAQHAPPITLAPRAVPVSTPAPFDLQAPFGVVHERATSGARILSFFRSEGIFSVAPPVTPPVAPPEFAARRVTVAVVDEPIPEETVEPGIELATGPGIEAPEVEPIPLPAAIASRTLEPAPGASFASAAEPEPPGELAPGMTFEQFSTTGFAAEVERESLVEPLVDVLSRAGLDAGAMPAIEHPALAEAASASPIAAGPEPFELAAGTVDETLEMGAVRTSEADFDQRAVEPAPEPFPAPASSATLARLYLEQGHLAEAEAEFRKVLEARPDDENALAGLRDVGRRRAGDETVSGWGAAEPASPRPPRAVGLTQRKVETLRVYLERIRRGRARANVS